VNNVVLYDSDVLSMNMIPELLYFKQNIGDSTVFYHCLHGFHAILSMSIYPVFVFRPSALFYCFIVVTICLSVICRRLHRTAETGCLQYRLRPVA